MQTTGRRGRRPRRKGLINAVRIIAGQWGSRQLAVASVAYLRPTPERVRETLFNWLQPVVEGSRCLDLFAGTGVLGVESVSRGAAHACLVEKNTLAAAGIRAGLIKLQASQVELVVCDALRFLSRAPTPFDIVFLDPPFGQNLLGPVCHKLEDCGWLARDAWIYIEHEARTPPPPMPPSWLEHRSGIAGEVAYRLVRRRDGDP